MNNVKLVLGALFALGEAVDTAKKNNGKYDLADLGLLVDPAIRLPGAIAAAKAAEQEYMNATDEQKSELIAFIKQDFDIADDKLEKKIEAGLAMLAHAEAFFE
jgi:hypothetical protein